jgi:hypothetical protein
MKPLRLFLSMIFVVSLPGCRGCQSTPADRPVPVAGVDGNSKSSSGERRGASTAAGPVLLQPSAGQRVTVDSAEKFNAYLENRRFLIVGESGGQADTISFDTQYGCMSASIVASVKERADRWLVYRIKGSSGGKDVEFFVTDPAGHRCPGAATGRGIGDIPDELRAEEPRSGPVEFPRSFSSYPLRFEWQVIETPSGKRDPVWLKRNDARVVLDGGSELRSDSAQPSINLCRPDLEKLKVHGAASYSVGVRLSPLAREWPADAGSTDFSYVCWSKSPILRKDVERLLGVVVQGELPAEPPLPPANPGADPRKGNR